jgi:hypothetical protein
MVFAWAGSCVRAAVETGYVVNVRYPVFKDNVLSYVVTAARGTLKSVPRLEDVDVQFYSPADSTTVTHRLHAKEAFYDSVNERIYGDKTLLFETEGLSAAGVGFELDLQTSKLVIASKLKGKRGGLDFSSDRAEVLFLRKIPEDEKDNARARVQYFEAIGNVHVINRAPGKRRFDEAFSERLIYDKATDLLRSPGGVRVIKEGATSTVDTFSYPTAPTLPDESTATKP